MTTATALIVSCGLMAGLFEMLRTGHPLMMLGGPALYGLVAAAMLALCSPVIVAVSLLAGVPLDPWASFAWVLAGVLTARVVSP